MKEKIREILTVKRGVVYGDFPGLIADLEPLINLEVEKRIAERMSDDEIKSTAYRFAPIMLYPGITCMEDVNLSIRQDIIEMLMLLRSRLTNPGDSQKTEGGGK